MHRHWNQPERFQDRPSDLGFIFAQQFVNDRSSVLAQVASEWREKLGEKCTCVTLLERRFIEIGRRNVIFRIQFADGLVWIARLRNPISNRSVLPDDLNRVVEMRSMESEVATMRYVKQHTNIPVPTLYGHDCTYDNPLGCPYLLMEHLNGRPVPDVVDELGGMTDAQIFKVHAQLANVSLQLARLCFPKIGQLYCDSGEVVIDGIVDRKGRELGTFTSSSDFYTKRAQYIYDETRQRLASSTTKPDPELQEAETAYLHALAAPFAASPEFDKGPFPLLHVDFHRQNVLVDHDWIIVGIIDWSWAATTPVDSFRPLPFNLADYVLPYNPDNVRRHEKLFWMVMGYLESAERDQKGFKLSKLRYRTTSKVASMLDWYSYPDRRLSDVEELLKSLPSEHTKRWNEGIIARNTGDIEGKEQ